MKRVFRRIGLELFRALVLTIAATAVLYGISIVVDRLVDDPFIVTNWTINNTSAVIFLSLLVFDAFLSVYAAVRDGDEDLIWIAATHFRSAVGRLVLALILWIAGVGVQFADFEGQTVVFILSIAPVALQANVLLDYLAVRKKLRGRTAQKEMVNGQ